MFTPAFLASPVYQPVAALRKLSVCTVFIGLLAVSWTSQAATHSPTHQKSPSTNCASISADTSILNVSTSHTQTLNCLSAQLRDYQSQSLTPLQQYFAYKAQAWLTYARFEYGISSESDAGTQALHAGQRLIQALLNNDAENIALITDIPTSSALMRPDLWAQLSALKDSGGVTVTPREMALSEVALIWAAADHCEHGWRQSSPQFRMAERWLAQARVAYINHHDSPTNAALEHSINHYYQQYAPLDAADDMCQGQALTDVDQASIAPAATP